ncbi:MAG: hypothetical protein IPF66_14245 [Holophagales bacterium]|nr:hypothetical protein [Holophagales bacterium]
MVLPGPHATPSSTTIGAASRGAGRWRRSRRTGGGGEDGELAREVCRSVGRIATGDLNQKYAEALRGVEVEGLSLKDFAEKAGITPNNAAVRVHRAREALRKRLVSTCSSCAAKGCTDCTCGPHGPGD